MKFNIKKFKELLLLNGFTIKSFSKATGINYNTLLSYTAGNKTPRADKLKIIADILNCKIEELLALI